MSTERDVLYDNYRKSFLDYDKQNEDCEAELKDAVLKLSECEYGASCTGTCFPALFPSDMLPSEFSSVTLNKVVKHNFIFAPVGGDCCVKFVGSLSQKELVFVHVFIFDPAKGCPYIELKQRLNGRTIGEFNVCPLHCALSVKGFCWNKKNHVLWILEEWGREVAQTQAEQMYFQTLVNQDILSPLIEEQQKAEEQLKLLNVITDAAEHSADVSGATADPCLQLLDDMCYVEHSADVSGATADPCLQLLDDMCYVAEHSGDTLEATAEPRLQSGGCKRGRDEEAEEEIDEQDKIDPPFTLKHLRFDKPYLSVSLSSLLFPQHLFLKAAPLSCCFNPLYLVPEIRDAWGNMIDGKLRFSYVFSLQFFLDKLLYSHEESFVTKVKQFFCMECGCTDQISFKHFLKGIEFFGFFWKNPKPFNDVWPYFCTNQLGLDECEGKRRFYFRSGIMDPSTITVEFLPAMSFHGMPLSKASIAFDLDSYSFFIEPFGVFASTPFECINVLNDMCGDGRILEGPSPAHVAKYMNKKAFSY